MSPDRIGRLIFLYCMDNLSEEDRKELDAWINLSASNKQKFEELIDPKTSGNYLEIESRIEAAMEKEPTVRRISVATTIRRYIIPAAAILVLFLGIYIWKVLGPADKALISQRTNSSATQDVAPGQFKAKLKLADGTEIILDSRQNGLIAEQDRSKIYNKGNSIEYTLNPHTEGLLTYNTLETSTGETYPIRLSDGTRVWLNSRSSIKFPVAFRADERKVEVTGEVYFEVTKNGKPFRVTVMNQEKPVEVQVLGTHFNINAYEDELTVKTTLLEGKVAVRTIKTNETQFIQPGQQVIVDQQGVARVVKQVDTNVVTAWKNQDFYFEKDNLKTVMRQLSRWYGVNVTYEGNVDERQFSGQIRRSRNLSEVLNMLKGTDIHFSIEGKNLTVKP